MAESLCSAGEQGSVLVGRTRPLMHGRQWPRNALHGTKHSCHIGDTSMGAVLVASRPQQKILCAHVQILIPAVIQDCIPRVAGQVERGATSSWNPELA